MGEKDDRVGRNGLAFTDRAKLLPRFGLDVNALLGEVCQPGEILSYPFLPGTKAWPLSVNCAIQIHEGETTPTRELKDIKQEICARPAAVTLICVGKELANVSFRKCAENRIADCVQESISVRMALKTKSRVRNLDAAQEKLASGIGDVKVRSESNS